MGYEFILFMAVVGGSLSFVAWFTVKWRARDQLPHPAAWGIADSRLNVASTGVLMGGVIYTAYTFLAAPGLAYAQGGFAFFTLVYTVLLIPVSFVVLPRLYQEYAARSALTSADYVRHRYGSHVLGLVVALTGIVATMPYLALQIVGLADILSVLGVDFHDGSGFLVMAVLLTLCGIVTFHDGLRSISVLAMAKTFLLAAVTISLVGLVAVRAGAPGQVFSEAGDRLADRSLSLAVSPSMRPAYMTLAFGSALAQLMYPQIYLSAFAARSKDTLRSAILLLPAWTALLGLFVSFGVAALAVGVHVPATNTDLVIPRLIDALAPGWLQALLLGGLAVALLVPMSAICVGISLLVVRNVYCEYFNPSATPKHEVRVARFSSIVVIAGAFSFALALAPQDAINLHLLGGIWILQLFPAVALSLFTTWFHPYALLAGWAIGIGSGTGMSVWHGFHTIVDLGFGAHRIPVYVAVGAFAFNLTAAVLLTPICNRWWPRRGTDAEQAGPPRRRGSRFAIRVH
ncbi:MAG: sodium:solute symporter [Streptomyces sp.]|nr:sodium:solute symporter [Streptomyces sp.]